MSLGYDRELNVFSKGDTAELEVFLYDADDSPMSTDDLISVSFQIQAPDRTITAVDGDVLDSGAGHCLFDDTTQVGQYTVVATFSLIDGQRSVRDDFEVIDPFKPITVSASYIVAAEAWGKFEDCFDAEDEGPWLRDMTLNTFNKDKMESFIDDALYDINSQNPPTQLILDNFILPASGSTPMMASVDLPLLSQGVMIQVIRHLMRSYTEQPNPTGAPIAWHDRRDYLQRWQSVYQLELVQYQRMVALFKRRYLQLGATRLLVSSKAGRLIPAPMRTRMAGRGYW